MSSSKNRLAAREAAPSGATRASLETRTRRQTGMGPMTRHHAGSTSRVIAITCLAFALSGCANLAAIREFAGSSWDAAQYSQLVSVYANTPARMKRYEPQSQWSELDRQAKERNGQRERLLLRHKLIQDYMDGLGQLAADGLPAYDKELDALGNAVK